MQYIRRIHAIPTAHGETLLWVHRNLPKHVERSDFFRYMVVLRVGGLYADVDTECRRAMDDIIKPRDTMLVGWENEFATPEIAAHRNYARTRQVLQWVFAAAPGHPALREICDHIAQNVYTVFSQNTNRDTLERTGPGVFTDYVLKHAAMHPPSKVTHFNYLIWLCATGCQFKVHTKDIARENIQ